MDRFGLRRGCGPFWVECICLWQSGLNMQQGYAVQGFDCQNDDPSFGTGISGFGAGLGSLALPHPTTGRQ